MINFLKKILPESLLEQIRPTYHYSLALIGAFLYGLPSREIEVVAVTGTKGKSTVTELVNAVLEEAGLKTALVNTLRFKIDKDSKRNLFKMTMPGRFFLQKILRRAVKEKCQWAVVEMTSEGVKQFRHKFIELDCLIFTNLSPEHIESHGSYENYVKAKLKIAEALSQSKKDRGVLIINNDDKEAEKFKSIKNTEQVLYSLNDAENLSQSDETTFKWNGLDIKTKLIGKFNVYNIISALSFAKAFNIDLEKAVYAIEKTKKIKGRVEKIEGIGFDVFVDYAHTPDSLEKLYQAFEERRKICVLGNTGGGRDKWKRPVMGELADKYCDHIILTNEDPYDEDPEQILKDMIVGIKNKPKEIVINRKEAIARALSLAKEGDAILITGKGTDPYIMGPNNTKIPWDDAEVVREELKNKKG